jgi:hypothetical protein
MAGMRGSSSFALIVRRAKGMGGRPGWGPKDVDFRIYHFATSIEAEEMQRWIVESGINWIVESGIKTRPVTGADEGRQLMVAGGDMS